MQKIILHFLLLFAFVSQLHAQCDGRYTTATFTASKKADILYGGNYDSNGKWTDLVLDVYEPAEDTASLRPLIIFVHGGSFVGGSRTDQRIDLTARHFAEKGYVTANIEYRVEQTVAISPFLNFASPDNWYKAIIRASHDLRAAIRYFKKDAATNGNMYKVDTNRILIYGSSAGAITALNTVFINDTTEMSYYFKRNIPLMGGLEGNSGNPGYNSNSGIRAIVSCSGAFDNINYLNDNRDIAYLAFHNNPDLTVPYEMGCFVTVACFLGTFYGPQKIFPKAKSLGMKTEFYPFQYYGHPVDAHADTTAKKLILEKTTAFLADVVCRTGTVTAIAPRVSTETLNLFPNPSNGRFTIELPKGQQWQDATLQIISLTGAEVYRSHISASQTLDVQEILSNGTYLVKLIPTDDSSLQYIGKISILK